MRLSARLVIATLALSLGGLLVSPVTANASTSLTTTSVAPTLNTQLRIYFPGNGGRVLVQTVRETTLQTQTRVLTRTITRYVWRVSTVAKIVRVRTWVVRQLPTRVRVVTLYAFRGRFATKTTLRVQNSWSRELVIRNVRVVTRYLQRVPVKVVEHIRVRYLQSIVVRTQVERIVLTQPVATVVACGFGPISAELNSLTTGSKLLFEQPLTFAPAQLASSLFYQRPITLTSMNNVGSTDCLAAQIQKIYVPISSTVDRQPSLGNRFRENTARCYRAVFRVCRMSHCPHLLGPVRWPQAVTTSPDATYGKKAFFPEGSGPMRAPCVPHPRANGRKCACGFRSQWTTRYR